MIRVQEAIRGVASRILEATGLAQTAEAHQARVETPLRQVFAQNQALNKQIRRETGEAQAAVFTNILLAFAAAFCLLILVCEVLVLLGVGNG